MPTPVVSQGTRLTFPGFRRPNFYVPALGLVLVTMLPFMVSDYYLNLAVMVLMFATLAEAWNLIGGYGGQMSLGHAAFFGLGAYTSTILAVRFGLSPWFGMLVGALLSVVLSAFIGSICFRLRGPYFTISTIALCEVLRLIFLRERELTGGGVGLSVPYKGNSMAHFQFLSKVPYYFIALALMLLTIYVTYRISKTKMGYYLRALGQNQDAAEVIGINTASVKQKTLAISAFLTSICGTFFAQYMYFIDPDIVFGVGGSFSIEIALIAMVGGMGTVMGPVVGSLVLRPIIEFTLASLGSTYSGIHLIVYGAVLMLIVLLRPSGLISWFAVGYTWLLSVLPGCSLGDGTGNRQSELATPAWREKE